MGPREGGAHTPKIKLRVRRRRSSFSFACTTPSTTVSGGGCSLFRTTSTQELSVFCCISASSLKRACCDLISSCRFFIFEISVWSTGESTLGFCKWIFSCFFISETNCLRSMTSNGAVCFHSREIPSSATNF
jgi:hypothetical protein